MNTQIESSEQETEWGETLSRRNRLYTGWTCMNMHVQNATCLDSINIVHNFNLI